MNTKKMTEIKTDCIEVPAVNEYSIRKRIKIPIILQELDLKPTDIVLDIGCGGGSLTKLIAEKGTKCVIGFDASNNNIKNANKDKHKNKKFVVGDALSLPFKEKYFDKVLTTEIIEHIDDDSKFVSEIARVLKKGGYAVITTPCTEPTISLKWLRKIMGIDYNKILGHKRAGYTKKQLTKLIMQHNLKTVKVRYYDQFFGELAWLATALPRILRGKGWQTGEDLIEIHNSRTFKIYKKIFPFMIGFAKLDKLLAGLKGLHILIKVKK